jgi:hypothetical protein
MAHQEPTRHQLSSKLSYNQHTPPFLLRLQNRISGVPDEEDEEDEYEYDGSGRPPIPRRPAIPTRPEDDPGSADEEDRDEKPQVVVLKEGKHLTEREAENVRRRGASCPVENKYIEYVIYIYIYSEKGLKPLDEPSALTSSSKDSNKPASSIESASKPKLQAPALSFSSSKTGLKPQKGKRKVLGDPDDDDNAKMGTKSRKVTGKKAKSSKGLLSFGDDA